MKKIYSQNIKKIIAITGSSGILGKKFIQKYKNFTYKKIKFDITNKSKLTNWVRKNNFDVFIHFAAIVPINKVKNNKKKAKEVNYIATKNIVDLLIKYKNNNNLFFFYASSSHVYKPLNMKLTENSEIKPINFYGETKNLSEIYIQKKMNKSNIRYSIGRIFSFTDVGQDNSYFIPSIFKKFSQKKRLYNFSGLNKYRDFVSTSDIVKAIYLLYKKKGHGIFNIGSGRKYLLKNIALMVQKNFYSEKKIEFDKMTKGYDLVSNNSKIKKLGWIPKHDISDILKSYHKKNK
ncbi:NAD(P)-dependent oxidoreductase [Candidatus Pelagibacter sp.]|nr:NAD(P)-dependent oxidoreductase [Candidatus Pelagibacter sp.]